MALEEIQTPRPWAFHQRPLKAQGKFVLNMSSLFHEDGNEVHFLQTFCGIKWHVELLMRKNRIEVLIRSYYFQVF